ncbi:conserved unknown protein [Ectocarpus siliculosus]|uniref:Uncharacterized protein n=1 Tax=Ectocarpus siliculosus TaxID=2880 RepID=D8LI49_ECTSI|nr:conserved unknown protein [Ectocarpus siliculosus]|eukprot:CBN79385.1 conserved unknown protein [Ectocarpus siliculosus]
MSTLHGTYGGAAGVVESSCCHPLDTIKTRTQLTSLSPAIVAKRLVKNEGVFALYRGLSAVMAGIVPKMSVRFSSFELYKGWLGAAEGHSKGLVFLAGLGSGVTEAVMVVTPAEVCKIRMQSQSLQVIADGSSGKYRDVLQTATVVVREEGVRALYKGLAPTVLRQGCNQAVNFTCYQVFKTKLSDLLGTEELAPWHHMLLGGLSGGIGPCVNNPLDVSKTRLQQQVLIPGQAPKYGGFVSAISLIAKEEGVKALWKGLTPRLMRIMPGQAITFMTYEWVSKRLPASLGTGVLS